MAGEFLRDAYFLPDKNRGTDTKELHFESHIGNLSMHGCLAYFFFNFLCDLNVCGLVHHNS